MDPKAASRIEKLIGMLTSDFEGERANAAALLTKMAKEAKQTLPEFLKAHGAMGKGGSTSGFRGFSDDYGWRSPPPPPPPPQRPKSDLDVLRWGLEHLEYLTQWEEDFCKSVLQWHTHSGTLSDKQRAVYERIKLRLSNKM